MKHDRPFNEAVAADAMTSRLAQIGLAEGWGMDVWLDAGRGDPFKRSEVYRASYQAALAAVKELEGADHKRNPMAKDFLSIWATKLEREAALRAKYWRAAHDGPWYTGAEATQRNEGRMA